MCDGGCTQERRQAARRSTERRLALSVFSSIRRLAPWNRALSPPLPSTLTQWTTHCLQPPNQPPPAPHAPFASVPFVKTMSFGLRWSMTRVLRCAPLTDQLSSHSPNAYSLPSLQVSETSPPQHCPHPVPKDTSASELTASDWDLHVRLLASAPPTFFKCRCA